MPRRGHGHGPPPPPWVPALNPAANRTSPPPPPFCREPQNTKRLAPPSTGLQGRARGEGAEQAATRAGGGERGRGARPTLQPVVSRTVRISTPGQCRRYTPGRVQAVQPVDAHGCRCAPSGGWASGRRPSGRRPSSGRTRSRRAQRASCYATSRTGTTPPYRATCPHLGLHPLTMPHPLITLHHLIAQPGRRDGEGGGAADGLRCGGPLPRPLRA